jgi:hypothetical protein
MLAALALPLAAKATNAVHTSTRLVRAAYSDPSRHKIQWRFSIAIRRSREPEIGVAAQIREKHLQSSA